LVSYLSHPFGVKTINRRQKNKVDNMLTQAQPRSS
jgi:hypothetical protein